MIVIGVDPGLKATGYGVIRIDDRTRIAALELGSIEPARKDSFAVKLSKIRKHLDDVVVRYQPSVMVLEKLYSHYAHPVTAVVMGHARGVICLVCAERNLLLVEESPKRVRKSVVGNGNASKEQTRLVVASFLKIAPEKLTLDISDALALGLAYANMKRYSG
jgi:crossover junction endodeoxyribonuclease RuvC